MNSNRPKIPVEPLSEARWAKIDDAVFAALDDKAAVPATPKPRRRTLYAFVGLVAAAAAILLFVVFRGGPSPTRGDAVMNPSHIETGSTPSRLAVGESTIEVGPSSSVVASGDDAHGILVVVEKGKVDCEVTPRKDRPAFVVQAGNVRVRVVGTRFVVSRDATSVHVTVAHGVVEVSSGADITVLHDGESWPHVEAVTPAPPVSAAVVPAPPTDDSVPATSATPRPARSVAPTPTPQDAQKTYEAAAKSEASDPDGAMVSYRRLASSGGPWAPTALFAAGRLASDRGRNGEAKKLLEDYLARYPRGANAEDARRILARLP